jgi:hypothetical protein
MFGINKKTEDKSKDVRPEDKIQKHPNVVKTLKDQEIKRDALAATNNMVQSDSFTPGHDPKEPVASAGYSQNTTNGSIQADGHPESLRTDSDDTTGKEAIEESDKADKAAKASKKAPKK